MVILAISALVWAVPAFMACMLGCLIREEDDPAFYAKAILWPIFALIYLVKGMAKAFREV